MPDLFHNPYHFVPLGPGVPPGSVPRDEFMPAKAGEPAKQGKYPHLTHDRFVERAHSGRIVCKVIVETPLICGSQQEERGEDQTKLIHPFELNDGTPALPASSLRGMLSSLAEAASHSALRVLKNTSLSHRMAVQQESLSAIGLLVERPGVGGEPLLLLQPLTVPTLRGKARIPLPVEFRKMFLPRYGQPLLKAYVDGYSKKRDRTGNFVVEAHPRSFLASRTPNSFSPEHQEFWYARLAGSVSLVGNELDVAAGQFDSRSGQFLLGQRLAGDPIPKAEFDRLPPDQQAVHVRGFLRILGVQDRERDMPTTKKHEYFVAYPKGSETSIPCFEVTDAVARFHALADSRTDDDPQLPFEVQGSGRNNQNNPKKRELRLRAGDIVFFKPDTRQPELVAEVAVSSIWRAGNGSTHQFFSAISPELLPLSPGRKLITLAEQLFGVVEVRDKKQARDLKENPTFALASRLRISHGLLHRAPERGAYQPHTELLTLDQQAMLRGRDAVPDIPLKNLASPKPPSPALYFKPKASGASSYVSKRGLNPTHHAPHGRKFYLRRPDPDQVRGNQLFVHPDRLRDQSDREGIARQHQSVRKFVRSGNVFYFHLDFDNLSDLELQLIAYVLMPHPDFRHQLGHGKPLGLGQIRIEPVGLLEVNRLERYKETTLTVKRYQDAWVTGNPTTDWPEDLRLHVPTAAGDLDAKLKDLRQGFETWARNNHLASVLRALELLGNPNAVQHPVHYPQSATGDFNAPITQETAAFEKELFRWFVQNDGLRAYNQHLTTLLNATSLPTLEREPPLPPPGGQGGHRGFGGDPTIGGARRDDRRAPEQQTRPVPTKPPQGPQKGDSLTFKVAAHEADKRIRFETNIEEQTWAAYLDVSRHDLARWLSRFPVGWVGQLTLQGTPVPGKQRMLSLKPPTS